MTAAAPNVFRGEGGRILFARPSFWRHPVRCVRWLLDDRSVRIKSWAFGMLRQPRRPALRIWPGLGNWHVRCAPGQGIAVRYSFQIRGGGLLTVNRLLSWPALRTAETPLDAVLRTDIAHMIRRARREAAVPRAVSGPGAGTN